MLLSFDLTTRMVVNSLAGATTTTVGSNSRRARSTLKVSTVCAWMPTDQAPRFRSSRNVTLTTTLAPPSKMSTRMASRCVATKVLLDLLFIDESAACRELNACGEEGNVYCPPELAVVEKYSD